MRILITTSTFPVDLTDGGPRFVFDLARGLSLQDEVEVLAPHAPGAARAEVWDGVPIRRFRYFWPSRFQRLAYGGGMRENMRGSWLAKLQIPLLLLAQTLVMRRSTHGVDVVNSHWVIPQGLTSAVARGRRRRFRHVLHVHAADVYLLAKIPLGAAVARFVLSRTDAVLADGSHVRDALDELVGSRTGAVLQPMGAWVGEFEAAADPIPSHFAAGYLAFVGRLVEKKGVVYLIEAMEVLRRHHPGLGLIIIGSGPLESGLKEAARRSGVDDVVEFIGAQPHEQVIRYLHGARLAVVPSVIDSRGETEGMPTVVIEMMAAGLPVVGSDVDGIPDVIEHGRNGWLARPGDPGDLASVIGLALENDDPNILESARKTAADHDWAEIAGRYVTYLREPSKGGET